MTNNQIPNNEKRYDLERRTTDFAKNIIRLCRELPRNPINDRIIGQLIGSSGSVGANYREANDALGRKDFFNRLRISRKESKETLHWLELLAEANPDKKDETRPLWKECEEFKKIFSSIIAKNESGR